MPNSHPCYTVDQYLKIERASSERCEYRDGEIYARPGENSAHGDISVNLVGLIGRQLKGTPCRVRTKSTNVRSGPTGGHSTRGMFSYPDVVVVCGEVKYHDDHEDVVTNPTVIVEVLSSSTEAFDRGEKFSNYQNWNPTLTDYVLVAQDRPQVEHYQRQADGSWSYHRHHGLDATVAMSAIGCTLPLAEVYDRVSFPDGRGQ